MHFLGHPGAIRRCWAMKGVNERDRSEANWPLSAELEAGLALTGTKTEKLIVPRALLVARESEKTRRVVAHRGTCPMGCMLGLPVWGRTRSSSSPNYLVPVVDQIMRVDMIP